MFALLEIKIFACVALPLACTHVAFAAPRAHFAARASGDPRRADICGACPAINLDLVRLDFNSDKRSVAEALRGIFLKQSAGFSMKYLHPGFTRLREDYIMLIL